MLASPMAIEKVEIVVNGTVVWSDEGLAFGSGRQTYRGSLRVPEGGWIAARAHGGEDAWPGMSGNPVAHTSPVWLNRRGSTEPDSARNAARDLLRALEVAHTRLLAGYGGAPTPNLKARFDETRTRLSSILERP